MIVVWYPSQVYCLAASRCGMQEGWLTCVLLPQVPCYAFDDKLKKHDLNPLIKLSGGYLVDDSDPETSLFINVCRDIGTSFQEEGWGVVITCPGPFDMHIAIPSLRKVLS